MNQNPDREAKMAQLEAEGDWLRWKCGDLEWIIRDELFDVTLEKALRYIDTFTDTGKGMRPWLTTIAVNARVDVLKKYFAEKGNEAATNFTVGDEGDELNLLDNLADNSRSPFDAIADRQEVEKALANINPDRAAVVRGYYLDGLTYAEMAEKFNTNTNTIGTRMLRGMEDLRAYFGVPANTSNNEKK